MNIIYEDHIKIDINKKFQLEEEVMTLKIQGLQYGGLNVYLTDLGQWPQLRAD